MILQMGRAAEARPYLERTLQTVKARYETKTLSEDELYEYAGMYTWYIRSLPDDTPLSVLYDTREKQLKLFKDMRENGARTILNQSEKLNVERAVVILLLHSGRHSEAKSLMLSIQDEFEDLLKHDPNNVGWRWHLMRSKLTLALLHHKQGQENDRNRELEEAIALMQKPDGGSWGGTTDIGRRINRLKAYRLYEEDSLNAALALLTKAQTDITDRRKGHLTPRLKYTLASFKSFKAELLNQDGRSSEAQIEQKEVIELLSEKDSHSITEQKLLLSAYVDLQQTDEEAALRTKLETRGVALDSKMKLINSVKVSANC